MLKNRTIHGPAFTAAAREKSMKNRWEKIARCLGAHANSPAKRVYAKPRNAMPLLGQ